MPPERAEAIRGISEAFTQGAPEDLTPEQQAAFERVQAEFSPDRVAEQTPQLQLGNPDSNNTNGRRATERVMDTNSERRLAEMEANRQAELEQNRQERERARQERRDLAQEQADVIEGFSQEDIIRQERERLGVPEALDAQRASIEEMRGLRQQLTDLEQQKSEAMATSESRQAPLGFIRGEQARIQEQFDRREAAVASRLQAENAHLQAMQGQVNQARALVGDIVDAATFDTEIELQRIQTFREVNQAELGELDRDIQNQLQQSESFWERRLQEERQDKETIANLMIENPRAGISIDDTLEEAANKTASMTGVQEIEGVALKAAQAGATEAQVRDITNSTSVGDAIAKLSRIGISTDDTSGGERDLEVTLGTPGKRRIAGAGFSSEEVSDIERLVNDTGIRNTIETLFANGNSTQEITAVAQEYEAMPILDEIEAQRGEGEQQQKRWWEFWK